MFRLISGGSLLCVSNGPPGARRLSLPKDESAHPSRFDKAHYEEGTLHLSRAKNDVWSINPYGINRGQTHAFELPGLARIG